MWLATRQSAVDAAAAAAMGKCVELKRNLSEAWAAGKVELMDQDPVDIVAPYVEDLKRAGALPVKDKQAYARALWKNWLEQFAWRTNSRLDTLSAPGSDIDLKSNIDDDELLKDIRNQCGSGADALIAAAVAAAGPIKRRSVEEERIRNRARAGRR